METLRNHTVTDYTRSTFVDCFICGNSVKIVTQNWCEILHKPLDVLVTRGGTWGPHCKARESIALHTPMSSSASLMTGEFANLWRQVLKCVYA